MEEKVLTMLKELQPTFGFEEGVDFVEAGYLDSFDVVQLVAELESQFGVLISALEILPENFASVKAICALVQGKIMKKNDFFAQKNILIQ